MTQPASALSFINPSMASKKALAAAQVAFPKT
jgi:hypothetical protein